MTRAFLIAVTAISLVSCNKNNRKEQVYQVNSDVSKAEWKGSAPDHFHLGSLQVTGSLKATEQGKVTEGSFVIPISSIECYDLQDPVKQQLLSHLKTADFFNVAVHPDAKFKITNVKELKDNNVNCRLTGDFTMIGETHPISFPAHVEVTDDSLVTTADFSIDRRKWGMTSFNDSTAEMYILPDVQIHLDVRAAKNK